MSSLFSRMCVPSLCASLYHHIINTHKPLLIPKTSPGRRYSHRQKNDHNALAESSASKPTVLRGEETHGVQTISTVALLQRLVLHGCPQGPTETLH